MKRLFLLPMILFALAACGPRVVQVSQSGPATATLAPIVSQTPRLTATPIPTRTPIPTFTPVPSATGIPPTPSDTPTPTEVPPLIGIVSSLERVNVREGPGVNFRDFEALAPGTGVEVLRQSSDGRWLNVQLEDGRQGWMASSLIRLQDTPTPVPSPTATTDLTAVAQGTVFPTAVLGGGTVTATPPAVVQTATTVPSPEGASGFPTPNFSTATPSDTPTPALVADEALLPVIDIESLNLTATALSVPPTRTPSRTPTRTPTSAAPASAAAQDAAADDDDSASPADPVDPRVRRGVDVLAYCDDDSFNRPAPTDLAAGSTIDIFWSWYAATEPQIDDHLSAARYEITLDGEPLTNLRQYRQPTEREGNSFVVYWFAPSQPLEAGEHVIAYRLTWSQQIYDGFDTFGPGTANSEETGSCTFIVGE